MTEDIYPMPSFPTLIVKDLEASSNFYQNVLGFKHIFTMPGLGGQPALVHLRWVKYADLLIAKPRDGKELTKPKGVGISLNFNMFNFDRFDADIDAFARQAREKGANITGPIDQPWNVREVTVSDPDGYKLIFTVPININLGFDKVIERAVSGKNSD
ncbi:MAG TPA: VOC family protein [Anaerolineales bacterium]|nr:VOC family protein [Anaerolineales bacterium]